jgi:hypothetical protein
MFGARLVRMCKFTYGLLTEDGFINLLFRYVYLVRCDLLFRHEYLENVMLNRWKLSCYVFLRGTVHGQLFPHYQVTSLEEEERRLMDGRTVVKEC